LPQLRIIDETRTPFAVKGGGHATNPGFSSTTGVQISMTRFNQVFVNEADSTVEVGAGLTWDSVYQALNGTGLNVVGGRVSGVGVAGFALGGGEWSSG
jgi:FAD/FMN-containing dehydrogenase